MYSMAMNYQFVQHVLLIYQMRKTNEVIGTNFNIWSQCTKTSEQILNLWEGIFNLWPQYIYFVHMLCAGRRHF